MSICLSPQNGDDPIKLDKAILLLGRHPSCDVVLLDSRKVSRIHCCIAQAGNRLLVRDLGSTNGIRVNGQSVDEIEIFLGDEVLVGDLSFIVFDDSNGSSVQSSRNDRQSQIQKSGTEQNREDSPLLGTDPPQDNSDSSETPLSVATRRPDSDGEYAIVAEPGSDSGSEYKLQDLPMADLSDSELEVT